VDGAIRLLVLLLLPVCGRPASSLQSHIAALENQRRPRNAFRGWRPGVFYYLFALVGAFWLSWLVSATSPGLRCMAAAGGGFGFLCLLPNAANRLGLQLFFRWPNRLLERRIAPLRAELKRRTETGPKPELASPAPADPPGRLQPAPLPSPASRSHIGVAGSR